MFKIKLLILLLTNLFFLSCTNINKSNNSSKFTIGYISGEYDGLLLRNNLYANLKSTKKYDESSSLEILGNIKHNNSLFITNNDNTSEREKIESILKLEIYDKLKNCNVYSSTFSASQFYIFASSENFLSNLKAQNKIKKENTIALIKKFINNLNKKEMECIDK